MQLLSLRQFLTTLFQDLLGTYTYPGGATKPAISVDAPSPGVRVTGLEVIIASVPRTKVAKMAYIAGQSAVFETYQLFLYQWSGTALKQAQYRIAQVWPDSSFSPGPPMADGSRIPSLQVGLNLKASWGLSGEGPADPRGESSYLHNQTEAAAVWTITHNLGFYPAVEIFDSELDPIEADVRNVSLNQVQITFSLPMTGFARLS